MKNEYTFLKKHANTEKAKSSHFDKTRGDKNQIFPTLEWKDKNGNDKMHYKKNKREEPYMIVKKLKILQKIRMLEQPYSIWKAQKTHPGVSGVSKDQKFIQKFKNTHCQVNHPAKIE